MAALMGGSSSSSSPGSNGSAISSPGSSSPGSSSPGSSHHTSSGASVGSSNSSSNSSSPSSSVSSVLAALSLHSNSSSSSCTVGGGLTLSPGKGCSQAQALVDDTVQTSSDQTPPPCSSEDVSVDGHLHPCCAPLIPADWCARLTSLSLDWLKVEGAVLQGPLLATLGCCSSLCKLSLVGYHGDVDALLPAVAAAGASIKTLNLQHSQVRLVGVV